MTTSGFGALVGTGVLDGPTPSLPSVRTGHLSHRQRQGGRQIAAPTLGCIVAGDCHGCYRTLAMTVLFRGVCGGQDKGSKSAAPCLHRGQTKSSGSSSPS